MRKVLALALFSVLSIGVAAAHDRGHGRRGRWDRGEHRRQLDNGYYDNGGYYGNRGYYGNNGYYGYRNLPPGLQKKLRRGGQLPPGWQRKMQGYSPYLNHGYGVAPGGYYGSQLGNLLGYDPRSLAILDLLNLMGRR